MDHAIRPTVGLIEDSDEDFALFSRAFDPDWDVQRWRSGEDAVADFTDGAHELDALTVLVIDLHLGGITGVQVVERVRVLPGGATVPICLLTSSRMEDDRRSGLDAGADAFLVKPDDVARLRELPELLQRLAQERPR